MNRSDLVDLRQIKEILDYLTENSSCREAVTAILGWFKEDRFVNLDWFLAKITDFAELSGDSTMLQRISELVSLRKRALEIHENIERCRSEMARLREEAADLRRKCGCRFSSCYWDGIENSVSCPFCFV